MNGPASILVILGLLGMPPAPPAAEPFEPVAIPDWVHGISRMGFLTPGQVDEAADAGVQVVHTNLVWPYFPLRRDGGGLSDGDDRALRRLVEACHRRGMRLILGLPPFPPVALVEAHPDWRIHPDDSGSILRVAPREDDLGTRSGCNLGPWGDYLIEVLAELVETYGVDGYSFDGNYHPAVCHCPACKAAYRAERDRTIPARVDLDDPAYREYLDWRGRKLEDHYRRMQRRLKAIDPETVVMSWTVNAGRYGHLLSSPRSMPARLNRLFDLPMQEWWLDETNLGASVAPAFGAAYLRGLTGGRPCGSEPYLMTRGNPYGTESFPRTERLFRTLLATTQGSLAPQSLGWPGGARAAAEALGAIRDRERWTLRARPIPWAAMLVSEQTRQFAAYRDIPACFLPHVYGTFRAALESHRPLDLISDGDLRPEILARYKVLILPSASALSDEQAEAIRAYVQGGGGLVASVATGLGDELGRRRQDCALGDVLGVRMSESGGGPEGLGSYVEGLAREGRERPARLTWVAHPLTDDPRLAELVPGRSATFRGPRVRVAEPADPAEVVARFLVDGDPSARSWPALIARAHGKGRVVFLAAGIDAALWSYAYPYQRILLVNAVDWAASGSVPIRVEAPMAVQASFFEQSDAGGERLVIHLFNGLDSAAHHGQPGQDVPLREEVVPIHGIKIRLADTKPGRIHVEPGGVEPAVRRVGDERVVEMPPLAIHAMLIVERP